MNRSFCTYVRPRTAKNPSRVLQMRHPHPVGHTYMCPFSTTAGGTISDVETIRQQCSAVLRTIAQPVSVLTTLNWDHERSGTSSTDPASYTRSKLPSTTKTSSTIQTDSWHGATLSSFTSIAMYPYPLISFSLRTPARMADLLRPLTKNKNSNTTPKVHLAINLLASHQSHLAIHFSHPRGSWTPTKSSCIDIQYTTTPEGIPILSNTLGTLCCTLIKSIPLDNIHSESASVHSGTTAITSELFIARVVHVLSSPRSFESPREELLPLVYHKQQYHTIK